MLEVLDLAATRGTVALFAGVSFTLPAGSVFTVTGPNGSGKTTLLRIIAGLCAPTAGTLRLDGAPVAPGAARLRTRVAFAGHMAALNAELSARQNLTAAMAIAGVQVSPDVITAALARTGLATRAALPARALSQGQQRRMMLARLLLGGRALWVLDEPATALDAAGLELLQDLLAAHAAAGGAALMATHQPLNVPGAAGGHLVLA